MHRLSVHYLGSRLALFGDNSHRIVSSCGLSARLSWLTPSLGLSLRFHASRGHDFLQLRAHCQPHLAVCREQAAAACFDCFLHRGERPIASFGCRCQLSFLLIGCCHVVPTPPRCKDQCCALDPQLMPSLAHSECNATAPGHQPVYCSVQVLGLP